MRSYLKEIGKKNVSLLIKEYSKLKISKGTILVVLVLVVGGKEQKVLFWANLEYYGILNHILNMPIRHARKMSGRL